MRILVKTECKMKETREIYQILATIDKRERKIRRRLNRNLFGPRRQVQILVAGMVLSFLASLASVAVYRFAEAGQGWAWAAIIFLSFYYLLVLAIPFVAAISNIRGFLRMLNNPLFVVFENSRIMLSADKFASPAFKRVALQALKDVRFEIKSETEALKGRVAYLIGAMDKVGVFPGILALTVLVGRLGEDQPDWAYGLAYATGVLYFLSMAGYLATSRAERLIGLIDAEIKNRDADPNNGFNRPPESSGTS